MLFVLLLQNLDLQQAYYGIFYTDSWYELLKVYRQSLVTSLRRIHSLHPALVNTRCRYAL